MPLALCGSPQMLVYLPCWMLSLGAVTSVRDAGQVPRLLHGRTGTWSLSLPSYSLAWGGAPCLLSVACLLLRSDPFFAAQPIFPPSSSSLHSGPVEQGDLKEGGTRGKCTASHGSRLEMNPMRKAAQQGVLFHLEVHPQVPDSGTSIRDLPHDL